MAPRRIKLSRLPAAALAAVIRVIPLNLPEVTRRRK